MLRLDGFLLPAFQPIAVLRDGDLLQVEPRQGGAAPKRKRGSAAAADKKSATLAPKAEPKPAASTAAAAAPKRQRGAAAGVARPLAPLIINSTNRGRFRNNNKRCGWRGFSPS